MKKSILVVEDDPSVRALIARALKAQYEVFEAAGAEGARKLLGAVRVPDLILCDVMMPGMSGIEFIRALKQEAEFKNVPVIFLTAKTGPMDVIAGINAGARHYITKPFQMNELLEKIAKAIK